MLRNHLAIAKIGICSNFCYLELDIPPNLVYARIRGLRFSTNITSLVRFTNTSRMEGKMLKKLKLLLSIRSWLNSTTLKTGGIVGVIASLDAFLQSENGMSLVGMIAPLLHLTTGTAYDLLLGLVSVLMLGLRAHTEWSLTEKNQGIDKPISMPKQAGM